MAFLSKIKDFLLKISFKKIFLKENTKLISLLSEQPIFFGLKPKQLKMLEKYTLIESITQQEDIETLNLRIENSLCCILNGIITVKNFTKNKQASDYQAGEVVNLASLIEGTQNSKINKMVEPTTVLVIQLQHLKNMSNYKRHIEPVLLKNAMQLSLLRLSHVEEVLKNTSNIATHSIEGQLEEVKNRMLFGIFVIRILVVLCLYTLIVKILGSFGLKAINSSPGTLFILSITAGIMYHIMLKTQLPMSNFGLTTTNWKVAINESLLFSLIFIGIVTLIKFLIILYNPSYQNIQLFDFNIGIEGFKIINLETITFFLLYILFAPVQEFLVRGGLQGSLNSFLYGTKDIKLWTSILVSNLLFTTFHIHISIAFAIMAFLPGIFWGWLYARHKTLIGVSISHIMVGVYIIFLLGISKIIPGII